MDQYVYDELKSLLHSMRMLEGDNQELSIALDDVETAIEAEWREKQDEDTENE
jgi:hypothetical protein